jgi:hypothetical protein
MSLTRLLLISVLFANFAFAGETSAVDFDSQIIPILTKSGCNSGACHGAAAGRGGFRLSLLGADAESDYQQIVFALEGRRIHRVRPERSLILLKSSEQIEHGGDVALAEDSAGAEIIQEWIRGGAERGARRKLASLEVSPTRQLVKNLPAKLDLKAVARLTDGQVEDVSAWTVFTSTDPASVSIATDNDQPQAHLLRRGQHVVVARFLDRVVPVQLIVPLTDLEVNQSQESRVNLVDEEVLKLLFDLRIPASAAAPDHLWLRRVTLDLTGRLPDISALSAFENDQDPEKREKKVDELLHSDAFGDYWTLRFAKLLRIHSLPEVKEIVGIYSGWLREQLQSGRAWNHVARDLLTATGDSHQNGPANFSRMVADPRDQAELVGQVFLGVRLGCANCHNHPLDRWTQDDFHGLAAVFGKLERGREVRVSAYGAVTNLRTGQPAVPRIPGVRDLPTEGDPRVAFADWLSTDAERYLARATVNRLWRAMFGRGLVEPPDDLRETNPATHPELLQRLADDFAEHRYDLRHTLKLLALSSTYARSQLVRPENASDDRFYSHAFTRRLEAEVLLDAISDVTGVPAEFPGLPSGTRAVEVIDPVQTSEPLDVLGQCSRVSGCDESTAAADGVATQLHLLNGDLLNARITHPEGRLHQHLQLSHPPEEIIRDFYLRAFSRLPEPRELSGWIERVSHADTNEQRRRLEDFVWSLLNSQEFREQH